MTTKTKPAGAKAKAGVMSDVQPIVRALRPSDIDAVIAIDAANVGRARQGFFVTRLAAVKRDPRMFLALGVEDGEKLAGFVIARVFRGEFGTAEPVASIDAVGVDEARQGRGLGSALMSGLEAAMRDRGIAEVMSQDLWSGAPLMRFFAACGFELAPRWVLERPLDEPIDF
ncbi:MAG TPA: GNAT family N-acetyltransferase [Alphaproteobacteria bacterium]|nr:GNAT family N-acetyltransferase [Alphaproteobacteria bacterium]